MVNVHIPQDNIHVCLGKPTCSYGKHTFSKIRLKKKLQGPSNCPPRELPRRLHRDPGDAAFTTSPRAYGNNGRNAAWAGGMSEAIEVIMNINERSDEECC